MCLHSWDYMINHKENEDENEKKKKNHIDTTSIDLGLNMDTNIANI